MPKSSEKKPKLHDRAETRNVIKIQPESKKKPSSVNACSSQPQKNPLDRKCWCCRVPASKNDYRILASAILYVVLYSCVCVQGLERNPISNASVLRLASGTEDPTNLFVQRLGLLTTSVKWESTEKYDPSQVFSDVVNVTPAEANYHRRVAARQALQNDTKPCVGDCPTALPLRGSAGSGEQGNYKPNVLPQWSKVMETRRKKLQLSKNESASRGISPRDKENGSWSQKEDLQTSGTAQWRIFKYVHDPAELGVSSSNGSNLQLRSLDGVPSSLEEYRTETNFTSSEEERFFNETLTSTERSLIRNSFFAQFSSNATNSTGINGTLPLDAFRSRRSPFRPHWRNEKLYTHPEREALYQGPPSANLHPPPPGLAVVQSVVPPPIGAPAHMPAPPYQPKPLHPMGMNDPFRAPSSFGQFSNGGDSPDESPSFRLPSFHHPFAKPKPMNMQRPDGRNPQTRGKRRPPHPGPRNQPMGRPNHGPVPSVMPAPRPIPVPRPSQRPPMSQGPVRVPASSGGGMMHGPRAAPLRTTPPGPPPIQYSYPKNAENIQDILTYFNSDDNEISNAGGKSNLGPPTSSPGIDAFSNELKEIHGSLLKDIREFAKRPDILANEGDREKPAKSHPVPIPRPSMQSLVEDEDEEDLLLPKPKPVRQLIDYKTRDEDREMDVERERRRDRPERDEDRDRDSDWDDDDRKSFNRGSVKEDDRYEGTSKRNRKPSYSSSTPSYSSNLRDDEEEDLSVDEERRERRPSSSNRHKYRDEDDFRPSKPRPKTKYTNDDSDERLRPTQTRAQFVQDSRELERLRRERERERLRRTKSGKSKSYRSKSSKSRRNKYYQPEGSNNYNRYPSSNNGKFQHRHRHTNERTQSVGRPPTAMDVAYYQQRNRPVVIKRPYEPYRTIDIKKLERERQQQDQYWNSVSAITVKPRDASKSASQKRPIENHFHYYGITATASPSPSPMYSERKTAAYGPTMVTSNSSPEDEDIVEIHTSRSMTDVGTTPSYPFHDYNQERDRKAKLQKMYMDYLQRKLEAQADAQADAMLSSSTPFAPTSSYKPKRPMRMKIHIYPNEQVQVVDQNNRSVYRSPPASSSYVPSVQRPYAPSPAYTNNYYHQRPSPSTHFSSLNAFGHYRNPLQRSSIVSSPSSFVNSARNFAPSPPPNGPGGKNNNVVLHLHVHRRNGEGEPEQDGGMMMSGSEHSVSTIKPLTYDEIYAGTGGENGNMDGMDPTNSGDKDARRQTKLPESDADKSISMELPIHQDKVDDVLTTLLKLRE